MCLITVFLSQFAFMLPQIFSSNDSFLVASDAFPLGQEFQRKLSQLTPEQKRLTEKLKNMALNNLSG